MSKNPFVFQGPVTEPDAAYFRDMRAVDSIVNGLLLGNYYTLLGPRFSGITSMTWDILRTAREREKRCRCLYIDLQALDAAVDERSLFQGIVKIGQGLPPETALPWSDVTGCAHFREALVGTVRGKPARLILALDSLDTESLPYELIKILVRCARVLYNQRLTDPESHKISVLIGGSQSPYALSTGSGSPFNIAEKYWLRDLNPQEIEQLIRMGQRLSGIFFDDAAIARIIAATEGDKYFVQGICHLCVREAQNAGTQTVTIAAVSEAIERLVSMDYREDKCFAPLVRSLTRKPGLVGILVNLIEGKEIVASEWQADVNEMQLTGVLKVDEGKYRFRNEVYERFLYHRKEMVKDCWRIHARTKKLIGLHDVTLEIASTLDPEIVSKEATRTVLRASEADTVAVYLFDRIIDRFRLEAVASTEESHVVDPVLRRDEVAREVIASQRHAIVEDWAFCSECDLHRNRCSCIWLPLVVSNNSLGAMAIAFDRQHDFSNEIMAAEIMASYVATAVIRTKLIDALRTAGGIDITGALKDKILQEISNDARNLLNVPVALIWSFEGGEPELRVMACSGNVVEEYVQAFRLRTDVEPTKTFLQRQTPLFLKDIQQAAGYQDKAAAKEMGWHSLLAMPLKAEGRPMGIIEVCTYEEWHVTFWQRALLKLLANQASMTIENAQLYQEVHQAHKALDDSLKILTHQLRAAPGFVTNTITTLLAGKLGDLGEEQRDRLEKAQRRLNEHHKLIDNINMYGRLKGGKIIPRKETIQLAQVIREVVGSYRGEARRRGLTLSTRGLRRLPSIEADEGMIEIVLGNLLDNAVKFTPQGGHIGVEAWIDTESVHIVVDDTGPGIPIEEREKVFDEYHQVESTLTRTQEGTGLGLYIAKKLVETHEGRIAVVDKTGPGTRIEVIVPR